MSTKASNFNFILKFQPSFSNNKLEILLVKIGKAHKNKINCADCMAQVFTKLKPNFRSS